MVTLQVMKNDHSWRGMIIKDNEGDWGICVAAWRGMKKGKPGVAGTKGKKGTPGVRGNPGHFAMKFINLRNRNRKPSFVTITSPDIKFKIDSLSCDLKKGSIKINSNETDAVQHVALAFVTSTLYLLVQPRPPDLPKETLAEKRGPKKVNFFNNSQFSAFTGFEPNHMCNAIHQGWVRSCGSSNKINVVSIFCIFTV